MTTKICIELQFERDNITRDDVVEYLQELIEDDSLDWYSVSVHNKDKPYQEFEGWEKI